MPCESRRDGTPATERQEARHYSWPPFEPGNLVAVRHGAFSARLVSARANEVRQLLLVRYPYLADDAFIEAIERYARAEARALMLHDYIVETVEQEGVLAVKPYLWSERRGADQLAQKCGQDCGLDATGHSRIARDLGLAQNVRSQLATHNIEALQAEGQRLAELRKGDKDG